ncbi:amphiphysin isoform X4 [Brachyhypopomus gauderio]|uniref:amphiphysin isoform X4 n=1 Tax=Brachyhypopomus gauderio TaxID=698409 RepID=UPI0040413B50
MSGIIFTNEFGQDESEATEGGQVLYTSQDEENNSCEGDVEYKTAEYKTAEEWGASPGWNGECAYLVAADSEGLNTLSNQGICSSGVAQKGFTECGTADMVSPFPDQSTLGASFGGHGSLPIKERNKAMEHVEQNSAGLDHDATKATQSRQQKENVNDSVLDGSDPFSSLANDLFGEGNDLFGVSGGDPFDTGNDPFANTDLSETDPLQLSQQDVRDSFDISGTHLFDLLCSRLGGQSTGCPVAPHSVAGGWVSNSFSDDIIPDLFANETNQGVSGNWESTSTGRESGEGADCGKQSTRPPQWASFPPLEAGPESSSKSCQRETSNICAFSDGQEDFIVRWPNDCLKTQDLYASLHGHNKKPKSVSTETQAGPKEAENSDLSEDEVANRRYGKLYQEIDTQKDEISNKAFNGFAKMDASQAGFAANFDTMTEAEAPGEEPVGTAPEGEAAMATATPPDSGSAEATEGPVTPPLAESMTEPSETTTATSPPTDTTANPVESPTTAEREAEETETTPADVPETEQPHQEIMVTMASTEDKESPIEETPTIVTKPEDESDTVETKQEHDASNEDTAEMVEKEEMMPIPSVVIEPASSNEGDDDRDCDITSPTTASGSEVTPDSQTAKDISSSGMPPGFKYKVQTMHDFEAANHDELDLKKGDIVLVVPTELLEDQDAGWLTGIKESDWLQHGVLAHKGLFPENFTQQVA